MAPVDKYTIRADEPWQVKGEGHYEVEFEGFTLDMYFKPSDVKQAYVVSPGWINREQNPYPYFQRIKWLAKLDGVGISLADPTQKLADDVQIGWFIGSREVDYTKDTARFLAQVFAHLGIRAQRVQFFGSSAGGYASLAFATHLRGSQAFAVNPQTEVLKFSNTTELAATLRAVFEGRDNVKIERFYEARVSIAALWKKVGYIPPTTVLMNTYDQWHMDYHIQPLFSAIRNMDLAGHFDLRFFGAADDGHAPPSPNVLIPMMRELMN